jgi:hypothetical protein
MNKKTGIYSSGTNVCAQYADYWSIGNTAAGYVLFGANFTLPRYDSKSATRYCTRGA